MPANDRRKLISRLSDNNDENFMPAFFELIVHALLLRHGHKVEIEPDVGHPKNQRPDFLASSNNGKTAYVEATVRSYLSKPGKGREKVKAAVLNSLDYLDLGAFSIAVAWRQDPTRAASVSLLKRDISRWINALDTEWLAREYRAGGVASYPKRDFGFGDGVLNVTAIPFRGTRTVAMESGEARWVSSRMLIRSAIEEKGRKYGQLDAPLVIAINVRESSCDQRDIIESLFGDQQVLIDREHLEIVGTKNALNGALFGNRGPRKQKVSAVLVFRDLQPWNVGARECTLVHNPFSIRQILREFLAVKQLKITLAGGVEEIEGRRPWSILGLNHGWPALRRSRFSWLFDRFYCAMNRLMPLP